MGDDMDKVLVVYGTGTGCTAGVAEKIGDTLIAAGFKADVVAGKEAPSPADYDAVFVGSGVRASTWHAPVRAWITANADALKSMPVAFFTVNLTVANEPEKTDEIKAWSDPLITETGVRPVDIGVLAGWNEPKRFSFIERSIMKIMKAPQGDFRDWDAIASWTRSAAGKLGLEARS